MTSTHLLVVALLLLPSTASTQAPSTASPAGEEITFRTSDGVTAYADLYEAATGRAAPLILLFHQGGGSARGEYAEIIPRLAAEQVNVLAVDVRGGGTRFGAPNRTVAALRDTTRASYCVASAELEGALRLVRDRGFTGPRFVWGSSFSATLALRLAAEHPNDVAGVLAFSPAAGGPMQGCEPQPILARLRVPAFVARPRTELTVDWIARLTETFKSAGIDTYVAENGVHGSSMLVPSRVEGDVEPHWRTVIDFLRRNIAPRSPSLPPGATQRRVELSSDGWRLVGDLVLPPPSAPDTKVPAAILLNGAGRDRRAHAALAAALAARGVLSLRLDLRGHGESTPLQASARAGDRPSERNPENDVAAARRFLATQRGIDTTHLAIVGASYSGEAMAIAGRRDGFARAYVALSPGSFSEESMAAIDGTRAAWWFIRSNSERFVKAWLDDSIRARSRTAEITVVDAGSAHATDILVMRPEMVDRVADWVAANLRYATALTDAVRLSGGPLRIDVLVDSARLGGQEVEIAEITFPPGGSGAPHRHGATELLYILQGELDHIVNGAARRLNPGMMGIVRVGDTVTHRVASSTAVRALVIWAPAGEAGRLMRARGGGAPVPIATIADHLDGLRALREGWSAAYNAGQLEPLRAMYTANAVRMPYDAPAQVGRDTVLAGYAASFATRTHTPTIRLTATQVEIRDDLAIERGSYDEVLTPKGEGRALREVGKYVSIARRGDDGRWRFEWSIFNRDRRPGP